MKKKHKKLIRKYALVDQTTFVQQLLQNDPEGQYRQGIRNSSRYIAKTSKGIFKGTDVQYFATLQQLQYKLDTARKKATQCRLRNDIMAIEDGYKGERTIKRWYAVPAHVASLLEVKGFVVLYVEDGYWWGW